MTTLKTIVSVGIMVFAGVCCFGQSTISNIPSTDITEPRTAYVELNFGGHLTGYDRGGFQAYGLKALYGVGRNLEIGANLAFTKTGEITPVEVAPNVKWKVYFNEKHKLTLSGGAVAFIPVRAQSGTKPSGFVYTTASKAFDELKGFRLTGGAYHVVGVGSGNGNRKGVMFGYEQTVYKKVSFFADWTSGKNRLGYSGVGLSIPFKKKNVFYAGYNFGNSGRGNNWLSVTVGRFF